MSANHYAQPVDALRRGVGPQPGVGQKGILSSDIIPDAGELSCQSYWMCTPLMARAMISRWISEVPSKML